MVDVSALRRLRSERVFAAWDGFVSPASVAASEQSIGLLIDELVALGPAASPAEVRRAVHSCVERFNHLDHGWICTIEREDICECLSRVVTHCGMDGSEEWVGENREW